MEDVIEMIKKNDFSKKLLNQLPANIKIYYIEDTHLFVETLELMEKRFIIKINKGLSFNKCKNNLKFIRNKNTKKKEKAIKFWKVIKKWLFDDTDYFEKLYQNNIETDTDDSDTDSDDIETDLDDIEVDMDEIGEYQKNNNIDKFIPRINQIDAFKKLENKIETGIHCQATGCGKSFIILKYIAEIKKFIKNPKVILFTERVSVLADLFELSNGQLEPSYSLLQKWKSYDMDITDYKIINRVTIKGKDWFEKIRKSNQPTLLVINRAYLTNKKIYSDMKEKEITLILHDECHNTTSTKCHDFLLTCKSKKSIIVGFSATPLRTGKYDKPKLLEIYGINNELNLITNYSMINAIEQELILPPVFHWYNLDNYKNNEISKEEIASVLSLLNKLKNQQGYFKYVAWCRTIKLTKKWKNEFEKEIPKIKNLKNIDLYLDTSKDKNDDYYEFKDKERDCILFCASKHREGSDIKNLDGCIFLDKVKNRGSIPFIQSIGRVLRKNKNKENGKVIDAYVKNKNYEYELVEKILDYYKSLVNISKINDDRTGYEKYEEMMNKIKFNKNEDKIYFKIKNQRIEINCHKLDWSNLITRFDKTLVKRLGVTAEDNIKAKANILKKVFNFNKETNFTYAYGKISKQDKIKYNLPNIDSKEYQELFEKKTWFELLDIKHNYYKNFDILVEKVNELGFTQHKQHWDKIIKKDKKIPKYPLYVYKNFDWNTFGNKKNNKPVFL